MVEGEIQVSKGQNREPKSRPTQICPTDSDKGAKQFDE